jgi:hypothetical protein
MQMQVVAPLELDLRLASPSMLGVTAPVEAYPTLAPPYPDTAPPPLPVCAPRAPPACSPCTACCPQLSCLAALCCSRCLQQDDEADPRLSMGRQQDAQEGSNIPAYTVAEVSQAGADTLWGACSQPRTVPAHAKRMHMHPCRWRASKPS